MNDTVMGVLNNHPGIQGMDIEDRMQTEIALALLYTDRFNHGTSGHLGYGTIARLVRHADNLQMALSDAMARLTQQGS